MNLLSLRRRTTSYAAVGTDPRQKHDVRHLPFLEITN